MLLGSIVMPFLMNGVDLLRLELSMSWLGLLMSVHLRGAREGPATNVLILLCLSLDSL